MTASKSEKSWFLALAAAHYPAALRGAFVGSIIGLAAPTAANLFRAARDQFAVVLSETVLWPHRAWPFLLVILVFGLLLYIRPFLYFFQRVLASWRVKPSSGLFWIWLVFSPVVLTLFGERSYVPSALILGSSVCLSFAVLVWGETRNLPKALSDIDPDLPIEAWEQDILGRRDLVLKLAEEVATGVASVVALVGAYGHGKTSTLNLLTGALRKGNHARVVVVPFVSSLATNEEVLVGTLFNSIARELQKRFVLTTLRDALARYASSLVGVVPKFGDALKELFGAPSQEDQIQQLKESLEAYGVRVVVVVDDMDRMHLKELEVLLKLMRGASEISNLTYLCAFDKEALARELSVGPMGLDNARNYLEKFFPVQVPLPKIDVSILKQEFDTRFEALCTKYGSLATEEERRQFNEKFGTLWQVHVNRCFSNLRRIKLFFNRVTMAVGSIAEEISLIDFVLLEIIRDVSPDIYENIYIHRRYFFYAEWQIETWMETVHPDEEKRKTLRKQFLDGLLHGLDTDKKELIVELLCELFPVVREYRGDVRSAWANSLEAKKARRICHPAFFPRYFIFGVQFDQFGEGEFNRLVSDLKKDTDAESCKKRFKGVFETLPPDSRRRWGFLDQVCMKIDRFGDIQAEGVALALVELADRLDPLFLGLGEADTARRVIFEVADKFADTAKVQVFLEKAIGASAGDYFAALIIRGCEFPEKNAILTKWENVNLDRLRESFRERMRRKYFVGGTVSIFDWANHKGAIQCLQLWRKAGGMEDIRSYLTDDFGKRPQSLGTLMNLVLPMEDSATSEQLKGLSDLYPLAELEARLNQLGAAAYSSLEEELAIARFRRLLVSARMARLTFKLADGSIWNATKDDGTVLQCVNGQVLADVELAEDGLPADKNLRGAVAAGIAEVVLPPSWAGVSARKSA